MRLGAAARDVRALHLTLELVCHPPEMSLEESKEVGPGKDQGQEKSRGEITTKETK